ncbi:type IV secretory system conjugative DNA transfer family protein [Siminovitchia terrae]|uniref:type IV secretory system conjugative DNA transfer family protein n=1 Tax=Siminovitchia terrae TaxID=1914933 RepID=UPI001FE79F79|nr:type IV secretory system conjugative DNA transfer family protein [Siminovitchia terrae]
MSLANPQIIPITWGGSDCFTHMLVVGPTRCGKTATILKPIIYQLLLQKKRGIPLGLSVVEPKGDVAAMVAEMSREMGLPYTHIDPMQPDTTDKFNPMEGEINDVAEATVVVLKGLFGKQDAFFATVQELSARNVTKLLKELHGDNMDIIDVMNTLRDQAVLEAKVAELKQRDGMTDLVHFFESELLGSMRDKYRQFVIGLRAQLENVVSNDALRSIMTGKSSIDIDAHFENGGILAVNTAMGKLRTSGDAFGQFVIMHLQNGTFRRPGTEDTRIPHYLIVDEYSRYINPDVEIFLNLAAEYKVAGIFATQSLGQLEIESGKLSARAMKRAILGGCRNIITFGGIKSEDAKEFADELGKDKIIMRQSTYKNRILLPNLFPDSYRDTEEEEYRFDYTDLMDGLPKFHFIHKLLKDGTPQKPAIGKGIFVPRDWKERREWETESPTKNNRADMKRVLNMLLYKRKNKKKEPAISGYIEAPKEDTQDSHMQAIPQEQVATSDTQMREPKLASLHGVKKESADQREVQTYDNRKQSPPSPKTKREDGAYSKRQEGGVFTQPKQEEDKPNVVLRSDDGFWD